MSKAQNTKEKLAEALRVPVEQLQPSLEREARLAQALDTTVEELRERAVREEAEADEQDRRRAETLGITVEELRENREQIRKTAKYRLFAALYGESSHKW